MTDLEETKRFKVNTIQCNLIERKVSFSRRMTLIVADTYDVLGSPILKPVKVPAKKRNIPIDTLKECH